MTDTEFRDWLTVAEVAEVLGLEDYQVRRSILRQIKPEDKRIFCRSWVIRREALGYVEMPKRGRPRTIVMKSLP